VSFRIAIIILAILPFGSLAQPVYNLVGNLEVDDCEGYFEDSDNALDGESYTHNENYVFTICVPSAEYIEMIFLDFETEIYDVLTIYDGPDTLSPVIGEFSGANVTIPTITSSGICLTFHWITDPSVAGEGWNAFWHAEIVEPIPPTVVFNPTSPTCSTTVVQMIFDTPIDCDSVYPGAVIVSGEVNQTVTNVTVIDCIGGDATTFDLTLAPGLNESGSYHLDYTYHYTDECDNQFELDVDGDFTVTDCPLDVDLFLDDNVICQGECTDIWAEVTGGDPNTYYYNWSPALPGSEGPHQVCPVITQVYTLTVGDAAGSTPSTESITLTILPPPTLDPQPTFCEQDPPIQLTANPSGGEWIGTHINEDDGLFHPDSGNGMPWVFYESPQGCVDSIQITIEDIWAGNDQASCLGAPAFMLVGFEPIGGLWAGTNVTSAGLFTPSTLGTFTLTYTAPGGCTDEINVTVGPIVFQPQAPVCQSADPFDLVASPFGGTWSGNGITDEYLGTFDPDEAGGGIHQITYTINGCSEIINIDIIAIDAYWNFSACPSEDPFQLTSVPAGGVWSGLGVSPTGLYSPGLLPDLTDDTLTYSVNGCSDERIAYIRITEILIPQLDFCSYDDELTLNWPNTNRYPGGGTWAGPGTDDIDAGHFTPGVAGPGNHWIFYEANTCVDSMLMIVHENLMEDTTICEAASAFILPVNPTGGQWLGNGIVDENTGMFDPAVSGIGIHWVYYQSLAGCWDSLSVDVYQLEQAEFTGLESSYCFANLLDTLFGIPLGGTFNGPGMTDSIFNPMLAGPGLHQIEYSHGIGQCEVTTTEFVSISEPIVVIPGVSQHICPNDPATVEVLASGGNGFNFTYEWNPNVTWLNQTEVYPEETTTYQIITWDGCSEPDTSEVEVVVEPKISLSVTTSEPQCQGAIGNASIIVGPGSNYNIVWSTDPPTNGPSIIAPVARTYQVTITDAVFGCEKDTAVFIPSEQNVTAYFTQNPNVGCLGESDPTAEFLDLTEGGVTGTWDFGDGTTESYQFGVYPTHTYPDTGHYLVVLSVENAGGTCNDTYEYEVCVQPEFKLWIPTAFTPDGDGLNDLFEIVSSGIIEFEFEVLSRWGYELHRMESLEDPWWDGTFKGKKVPEDYYAWSVVVKARHLGGFAFEKKSGMVMLLRNGE
jgi:gliding motility-associated-like protein